MLFGVVLVGAAAVGLGYPMWWHARQQAAAKRLEIQFHQFPTLPAEPAQHCVQPPSAKSDSSEPAGILTIPSLTMSGPVLQGLGDPVLNVAIGHDPASVWPGGQGVSILESHDVSYFSRITALRDGQTIEWLDHCTQLTFKVTGYEVTGPGTLLNPPPNGRGLALVTCYPSDVLFWTPERYVVLAELVTSAKSKVTPKPVPVVTPDVTVPAPPALVAQGLQLTQNEIGLGTMTLVGTPVPGWREGPAPLDLDALSLESYFGAEKAIEQGNTTWWRDLAAPGVAMPQLWNGGGDLYVTEDIIGTHVQSVTLTTPYVTFVLVGEHHLLLIKSVTVSG
jgi:sortase A